MEIIQDISEISIFNKIKAYAENKGYDVILFKDKMPKIVKVNDEFEHKEKDIHYIQIFKDFGQIISIYYDDDNWIGTYMNYRYYELYCKLGIKRYPALREEEESLFEEVKKILN